MNMVWLISLFYFLLCLTAKCQESVELLPLHDTTMAVQSENGRPVAVQVEAENLHNVSQSVLMAESWLRNYVLAYYPAINVSTIVVGNTVLCSKDQKQNLGLVLPSIKNIHYSLTRWGLQNDITVSASFSSDCLDSESDAYRVDVAEIYIKPLLSVLQEMGSPYVVNPPPHLHILSDETSSLLKSHSKSMKNLGVFEMNKMNVIITSSRMEKPSKRRLSFIDISNRIVPFPPRPTPIITPSRSPSTSSSPANAATPQSPPRPRPVITPSPSPSGSSNPAYAATPLPPLVGIVSPPPNSLPFAPSPPPEANPTGPPFLPHLSPMANPASPPYGPHLPPCEPSHGGGSGSVGAPVGGVVHHGVWCVAKPSVPAETLQEALDYACGEGNADCEAIQQDGSCYYPDSLVAHASYAFNSYWQKTKRSGGSCGFGGTAMLINSDPSYAHCRFILT